ncbi:hypothetical protein MBM_00879 [Drepanopeziza brunnea f. sp. 'multigermtubi' MB_m1]|uniref:Uncharacterized protein n=1 Tax=Marssonina brunnea f. sp. multigermtubi (strain MB_m1) TaxID=1072389 RepID=K1X9K7_MARBU|nr:uncharacterized protein MBM_00879 [Drepanopeziza brunnea f. sp. 'multigermtubi' MB_m1]EKD21766.1 hypothetical protein MBM_00879 [Drepanopeziza brunnea f. sp. 'multigermtubi' MB_m1]
MVCYDPIHEALDTFFGGNEKKKRKRRERQERKARSRQEKEREREVRAIILVRDCDCCFIPTTYLPRSPGRHLQSMSNASHRSGRPQGSLQPSQHPPMEGAATTPIKPSGTFPECLERTPLFIQVTSPPALPLQGASPSWNHTRGSRPISSPRSGFRPQSPLCNISRPGDDQRLFNSISGLPPSFDRFITAGLRQPPFVNPQSQPPSRMRSQRDSYPVPAVRSFRMRQPYVVSCPSSTQGPRYDSQGARSGPAAAAGGGGEDEAELDFNGYFSDGSFISQPRARRVPQGERGRGGEDEVELDFNGYFSDESLISQPRASRVPEGERGGEEEDEAETYFDCSLSHGSFTPQPKAGRVSEGEGEGEPGNGSRPGSSSPGSARRSAHQETALPSSGAHVVTSQSHVGDMARTIYEGMVSMTPSEVAAEEADAVRRERQMEEYRLLLQKTDRGW